MGAMGSPQRALLALSLALASSLSACSCGGSDGGSSGGDTRRTAAPLPRGSPPGVTSFGQSVPAEDDGGELFPGQANSWVLLPDFSLGQGYGLQVVWALQLWAGAPRPAPAEPAAAFDALLTDWMSGALLRPFPNQAAAADLTWLSPVFSAADGLVTALATTSISTAPLAGVTALSGTSGFLAGTADSRLVRTVELAADQTYTLTWRDERNPSEGALLGGAAPPHGPRYQVVLRSPADGALLGDPLFLSTSIDFAPAQAHTAVFSTTPGAIPSGPVELSFEFRSGATLDSSPAYAVVDAVGLSTVGGALASFTNGDFESGLAPWRAGGTGQPQNVRSAPRTLSVDPAGVSTLVVTRTLYAPPAATWARLVDVFENGSDAEVATTVVYATQHAGATDAAWESAAEGRAVVGRDRLGLSRDVGVVFGAGIARFDPASLTPYYAFVVHPLRVPPRGAVALVHFVVQLGQGSVGADHTPTGTLQVCQDIAAAVRSDPRYLADLEPGVLGLVKNF